MDTQVEPVNDGTAEESIEGVEGVEGVQGVNKDDAPKDHGPSPPKDSNSAPRFPIPKRTMGAVEIPMIVMNLDRTEKAFGNVSSFQNVCIAAPKSLSDTDARPDPRQ